MKYLILSALMLGQAFQLIAQPCTPSYDRSSISVYNFSLADITHIAAEASEGGYTYYPDSVLTTALEIGRTYPISITTEFDEGSTSIFSVWLDYNEDNIFSDEELIHQSSAGYYSTGTITISPDTNLVGKKRVRVSAIRSIEPPILPCGRYFVGGTNDYEVTLTAERQEKEYYCIPFNAHNIDNFIIREFLFGDLHNRNSDSNESNYSVYEEADFSGSYTIGESYEMLLSKNISAGNTGSYSAWIDYNSNFIFEEEERIFHSEDNVRMATAMITIPDDPAIIGKKRLRVRSQWRGDLPMTPCSFNAGTETEDYTITILGPLVSANDFVSEEKVEIFPNPVTEWLHIKSPSLKNYHYTLINDFGQLQAAGILNNQQLYTINISQLSSGIYFLQLVEGKNSKRYKFVKL